MNRTHRKLIGLLAAMTLVFAACGDDDADTSSTTEATSETTDANDDSTTTTAEAGGSTVVIGVNDTDIGQVLADTDGHTLYVFDPDGTGEPTCTDACAEEWPALVAENIETHGELDIDVNSVESGDSTQVTINGRPVYRYAGDSSPGQTNGQGIGGVWWALDADGNPIETAAGAGAPGAGEDSDDPGPDPAEGGDSGDDNAPATTEPTDAGGYNY